MLIKFLKEVSGSFGSFDKNTTADIEESFARSLIAGEAAVAVEVSAPAEVETNAIELIETPVAEESVEARETSAIGRLKNRIRGK